MFIVYKVPEGRNVIARLLTLQELTYVIVISRKRTLKMKKS